jgi:hypothetical protein
MVRKSKIRTIFLLPSMLIIFLTGWCLQFASSSKKELNRKKENFEMHFGVLALDEQLVAHQ